METFERVCTKNYSKEFTQGGGYGIKVDFKKGKKYLTSRIDEKGTVMVFTTWWIGGIPVEIFGQETIFTTA